MAPVVDPITRQIIRNALCNAAAEMQTCVVRTAHSPLIYEVQDFAVCLTDARGRLVAEGSALAGFLGCLPPTIRSGLDVLRDHSFRPGDVVLANDPYDTGTHISDTVLYVPIFFGATLVGFAVVIAHWADIGGYAVGGWCPTTTSVHQEGLIFKHILLYEAGVPNRQLRRMIMDNVRFPEAVDGDLNAMIAACGTGARRIEELCGRYGVDTFHAALDEIFALSEARMRREIAAIPPGTYRAEAMLDHDGLDRARSHRISVAVTVSPEGLEFDFAGSDPATRGPVNQPLVGTAALCGTIMKSLLLPHEATNDGHLRLLQVSAPAGTIVSADYPAPCDSYGYVSELVEYVILRALAEAVPERVPAPSYQMFSYHLSRADPAHGTPFLCVEPVDGGGGGLPNGDGPTGIMFLGNGDAPNTPVEVLEASYPLRVGRYEIRDDNSGIGRFRGGHGVVRDLVLLEDGAELQISTENNRHRLWGLWGGGQAGTAYVVVTKPDGETIEFRDRVAEFGPIAAGTVLSFRTPNGGGWGDPARRDPALIAADIRAELLPAAEAAALYGVAQEHIDAALERLDG